jgi:hypothetical protein
MGDAHFTAQALHVLLTKYIANQADTTTYVQSTVADTFASHDPGSVLPTMLKQQKTFVQSVVDREVINDTHNSAHEKQLSELLPLSLRDQRRDGNSK